MARIHHFLLHRRFPFPHERDSSRPTKLRLLHSTYPHATPCNGRPGPILVVSLQYLHVVFYLPACISKNHLRIVILSISRQTCFFCVPLTRNLAPDFRNKVSEVVVKCHGIGSGRWDTGVLVGGHIVVCAFQCGGVSLGRVV